MAEVDSHGEGRPVLRHLLLGSWKKRVVRPRSHTGASLLSLSRRYQASVSHPRAIDGPDQYINGDQKHRAQDLHPPTHIPTHPVRRARAPDDHLARVLEGDGHVHARVQEVRGPHAEVVLAWGWGVLGVVVGGVVKSWWPGFVFL